MLDQPLVLNQAQLARSQCHEVEVVLKVTGAGTNAQLAYTSAPVLTGYAAASLTEALVEAFLDHETTIPCATCFDAVSLGVDAIGFVLDMGGQALRAVALDVSGELGGTAIVPKMVEASQTALGSALADGVASADGDIYGRLVITGLDAATSGFIKMLVKFEAK